MIYFAHGKKETEWIYIDYTKHMPETNSKEEMRVESTAGAHGVFDVTIENPGGNIWVSEIGLHQEYPQKNLANVKKQGVTRWRQF